MNTSYKSKIDLSWLSWVLILLGGSSLCFLDVAPWKCIINGPDNPASPGRRPVLPPWLRPFSPADNEPPIEGFGSISLGGRIAPDKKTELQIDFPLLEHIPNIGSKVDGLGMCVMSSIEMSARWANLESLRGLRDWAAKQPGGGWPGKVDKQLEAYFKEFNLPSTVYLQYEGKDLQMLRVILDGGRFPSVTYSGRDKVRYSSRIAHMVCLAHLDSNFAAIWDNNGNPGELLWMTPKEFSDRWLDGSSGWAFVWIAPPPPPVPRK